MHSRAHASTAKGQMARRGRTRAGRVGCYRKSHSRVPQKARRPSGELQTTKTNSTNTQRLPAPSAIRSCFTRRGAASLGRGLQVVRRLGTAVHVSDASVRQPSTETTSNGRHTLRRIPPHAHLPRTHLRTRQLQRARQVEEFAIQPLHGRVSRVVKHERALALHRRWCTHTDCGEPRTSA